MKRYFTKNFYMLAASVAVPLALAAPSANAQDSGSTMRDAAAVAMEVAKDRFSSQEAEQIKDFFRNRAEALGQGRLGQMAQDLEDDLDPDDFDLDDDGDDDRDGRDKAAKGKAGKGKAMAQGRGNSGKGNRGRGGRSSLPPGIAKNLERGKPLPPGIARNYLPDGLEGELPIRTGQSRVVIDDDIVLVDEATNVVIDILQDVLTP